MARPLKLNSPEEAETAKSGESFEVKGHERFGLYIRAYDGFDPSNDELAVRVEGAPASDMEFARIDRGAPKVQDVLRLEDGDLEESDEDGVYTGFIASNSYPIEALRANILKHSGGFKVDATVFVTGAGEAAYMYREPGGV